MQIKGWLCIKFKNLMYDELPMKINSDKTHGITQKRGELNGRY